MNKLIMKSTNQLAGQGVGEANAESSVLKNKSQSVLMPQQKSFDSLPKFKPGNDITPIITILRTKIKKQQKKDSKQRVFT